MSKASICGACGADVMQLVRVTKEGKLSSRGCQVKCLKCEAIVPAGQKLVPCNGEAHDNPAWYDHCMSCAPRWGFIAIPERFETLDEYRQWREAIRLGMAS